MSDDKKTDARTESTNKSRDRALDDFWDISALVPPKKKPTSTPASITLTEITAPSRQTAQPSAEETRLTHARPASPKTETASELRMEAVTEEKSCANESSTVITRYIPPNSPPAPKKVVEPDDEYAPQGSMLHRVRIYRWKTAYQYYEDFYKHAQKAKHMQGSTCQPVAFFSYVPQYSQLNRAQLNWYLYWRDGVRRGEILPTDYSYILLYIYEIINLADEMDVRVGQQQLCALRAAFHTSYPRLGHLLNEWICDYSLIHHLPPPMLDDLGTVADCTLKEFYVPSTDASLRYAVSLVAFGSNYAYTKSKFATGENRTLYDRHMSGALCACLSDTGEVGERMASAGLEESRLIRDAYVGALCSHRAKRRIEIDYCSFARSHELRILVTDIMKYTENKLRAYLGIKSRLGLYALPQSFRDCIDAYMRRALPQRERAVRVEPRQEYDALYDVPKVALSLSHAAEIEASSWDTTERLITAFEERAASEESAREVPLACMPTPPEPSELPQGTDAAVPDSKPIMSLTSPAASETLATDEKDETRQFLLELGELRRFINLSLQSDIAGQRIFARECGEMIDSMADRINELATEWMGDILLEECDGGGYAVIEDYRDMMENGLKGMI